ncbi:hypothetical protein NBRC116593_26540 [Sulfitobacter pacificus]
METTYSSSDAPPEARNYTRCRGKPFSYVQIIYQPTGGVQEKDTFEYDRISGDKFDIRPTLEVTLRDAKQVQTYPWDAAQVFAE